MWGGGLGYLDWRRQSWGGEAGAVRLGRWGSVSSVAGLGLRMGQGVSWEFDVFTPASVQMVIVSPLGCSAAAAPALQSGAGVCAQGRGGGGAARGGARARRGGAPRSVCGAGAGRGQVPGEGLGDWGLETGQREEGPGLPKAATVHIQASHASFAGTGSICGLPTLLRAVRLWFMECSKCGQ